MDNFQPQAGGMHLKGGHEGDEFSIRGIVLFLVILALSGVLTFIAAWALLIGFEWFETKYIDAKSTPVQRQLREQRGETPTKKEGIKPQPDWYQREVDEKVLEKTFVTPRLQYDDAEDMKFFLDSEKRRLNSTGKDPDGSIHINIDQAIDVLSRSGLPAVNGTFTPQPPQGSLEAVAEAAQRRVNEATAQGQQKKK
ncbi:MAG TPA: hypothetical protein VKY85_13265 [Candidatus Angelobacter sp.]|nr:hypothetical protein [Candidatus Angelobacter sp.]